MIYDFFAWISAFAINVISDTGYFGIAFLMALESACIPIPSEIIMPFSGYLVWLGKFNLLQVALWGAIGNVIGSVVAYIVGFYGGRPLLDRYGKYLLISNEEINRAQEWFAKYGSASIFFSRLLPVVRTFISFPAGIARMNFGKFLIYTFLGCLPWAFILTYAGVIMGENWKDLEIYFKRFDWLILILFVASVSWWFIKKFKNK
ncbi:MAG: DedA family protein [Candidatus Pacebacteria bacterium]|nr:DedA family protein [Candidatus Paceibacterota bacterium]